MRSVLSPLPHETTSKRDEKHTELALVQADHVVGVVARVRVALDQLHQRERVPDLDARTVPARRHEQRLVPVHEVEDLLPRVLDDANQRVPTR